MWTHNETGDESAEAATSLNGLNRVYEYDEHSCVVMVSTVRAHAVMSTNRSALQIPGARLAGDDGRVNEQTPAFCGFAPQRGEFTQCC